MSEQDRFRVRRIVHDNLQDRHLWHEWWAWRPVQYTGSKQWVWLRGIYRRALYKTYATYDDWQKWEYGTVLDVLGSISEPAHQR